MDLITLSDVQIGYGSPQIFDFTKSVCKRLNFKGKILQPRFFLDKNVTISNEDELVKIDTIFSSNHPHGFGNYEYLREAANILNKHKPKYVILTNYKLLHILNQITYRPHKVIFMCLEMYEYNNNIKYIAYLKSLNSKIDIWIFPNDERAAHQSQELEIKSGKLHVFYNISNLVTKSTQNIARNKKFIYAGTIDRKKILIDNILDQNDRYSIDVYGKIQGSLSDRNLLEERFNKINFFLKSKINYKGNIPSKDLNKIYSQYSFSLILWSQNVYYPAPNKFFQAIIKKVPVIITPYEQGVHLIERYGCGLYLKDFSSYQLNITLNKAIKVMNTPEYSEMVENCKIATQKEFNWESQVNIFFNKFDIQK